MKAGTGRFWLVLLLAAFPVSAAEVQIMDGKGDAGEQDVVISLTVSDASGIAGGDLEVHYDADALVAQRVEGVDLSSDWLVSTNLSESGIIRISLAGSGASRATSGTLLEIYFEIRPEMTAGTVVPLQLISAQLNNEMAQPIPVTALHDGTLTVERGMVYPEIAVSDVNGLPGSEVTVSISVSKIEGIAGGDFELDYDVDLLTPVDVSATELFEGMLLISNLNQPGKVVVSLAGAEGMPAGSGTVLNIAFQVSEDAEVGEAFYLTLSTAKLNDAAAAPIIVGEVRKGLFIVGGEEDFGPVSLDLDDREGNQEQTSRRLRPGQEIPIQVYAENAPESKGYTITLLFDPDQLSFTRFEESDFIPGLITLPAQEDGGIVVAGGVALGGGNNSGDGFLGIFVVTAAEDFAGETTVFVTKIAYNLAEGGKEEAKVLSRAMLEEGGLLGDFNDDGAVDFNDFFLFADFFGQQVPPAGAEYDLSGDKQIDFDDFFIFADMFGQKAP